MRKLVLFAAVAAVGVVFAADEKFPNFIGTTSKELTLATNWDTGKVPDADAVATISQTASSTYTIAADTIFAVKGIRLDGSTGHITLSGSGSLTVGSEGVSILVRGDGSRKLSVQVPVTIAANQIWNLATNSLATTKAFTGTYDLAFSNITAATHSMAPNYGGKMLYLSSKNGAAVDFTGSTRWCERAYFKSCKVSINGSGEYDWSDIFPGGEQIVLKNWGSSGLRAPYVAGSTLNFKPGDNLYAEGDGHNIGPGTFNMTGGYIYRDGLVTIPSKTRIYISGNAGMYYNYGMMLASGASDESAFSAQVIQSGGAVTNKNLLQIGGRGGAAGAIGEYRVDGGFMRASTLNANSWDNGVILVSSRGGNVLTDPCVGVLTQRGGTIETSGISLGSRQEDWGDGPPNGLTNAFAMVSIEGGTFNLGRMAIITNRTWNVRKSGSTLVECPWAESRYRFRLSGGKFVPYYLAGNVTSLYQNFQWDFPPAGDSCATVDCSQVTFRQGAPISGEGCFVKTGNKNGYFTDLSRFTGKFVLAGGTNSIAGITIPTGKYDTGCMIFRADDAAEGKAEGDEVASWTDSTGTKSATTLSGVYSPATNCCLNPTVKLNDFNGHAGLNFAVSGAKVTALALPTADNPLVGCNDFTVAVVFKTTLHGACGSSSDYEYAYSTGILGTSVTYGNNGMGISISGENGEVDFALAGRSFDSNQSGVGGADKFTRTRSAPYRCNDGKVHVFVYSSSGQLVTSSLDGWCDERNRGMLDTTKKYLIGCKQLSTTTITAPFMIGVINSQVWNLDGKATPNRGFRGTMAEIRIYPNRFMTTSEMNALAYELNQKYNPEAKNADGFMRFANRGVCGTWADVKDAAVALPAGAVEFNASSATVAAGSEVTSLPATSGSLTATASVGGGEKGPTLVKDGPAGKAFLRFKAADKTALGIASGSSPISGKSSFAVAVVFRTHTDGIATNLYREGRGLVSTVQNASGVEDMAIALQGAGTFKCGIGSAPGGATVFSRKPCMLNDGQVHVVILNLDMNNKLLTQMVDGLPQYKKVETTNARGNYDLLIGSLCKDKDWCYYTGDIGAVAIWDKALTRAEIDQVTTHYAQEYSFYPLAKGLFTEANLTERGIAAKEIVVEDGAALILAESAASPFTLKSYQTVTGDGRVFGSVRWGENAVYDTDAAAKDIDDVQLASAKLKFAAGSLPFENAKISSISGSMKLDVSAVMTGSPALRTTLMNVAPGVVKDGTTFEIIGGPMSSRAYYDNGKLILHSPRGSVILLR